MEGHAAQPACARIDLHTLLQQLVSHSFKEQIMECCFRFHFAIMAWLPSYFTDTMRLDLTHAAQISLIPPAAGVMML